MLPVTKIIVNNFQIIVVLMNIYAIMLSDEWVIKAMMKNRNIEKLKIEMTGQRQTPVKP